jgi:hypothetical protein
MAQLQQRIQTVKINVKAATQYVLLAMKRLKFTC